MVVELSLQLWDITKEEKLSLVRTYVLYRNIFVFDEFGWVKLSCVALSGYDME